ncbi:MAG TPA: RDD family protein [Acidobacteriaceae bacterium]
MQGAVGRGEQIETQGLLATGTEGGPTLREVVAERVAAHRSRRAGAYALEAQREEALRQHRENLAHNRRGSSLVRDVVRARYENSPTYREFLAAEAERALEQAQAEADMAARKAHAVAEAQFKLLEELRLFEEKEETQQWNEPQPSPRQQALADYRAEARSQLAHELADIALGAQELIAEPTLRIVEATPPPAPRATRPTHATQTPGDLFATTAPISQAPTSEVSAGGLTVRLYEDLGAPRLGTAPPKQWHPVEHDRAIDPYQAAIELEELDQEIEFRRAPEFADHVIEAMPLPANLIEFPRQLIASRKARPRLAEGPLREEASSEPQLRIFEVEPEQISTQPAATENPEDLSATAPGWQGLLLDSTPVGEPLSQSKERQSVQPMDIAPVHLRLMAATVDACCIAAALVAFATAVTLIAGPALALLSRPLLTGSATVALLATALIYQLLFFTFSESTPGMRYARIGLCTFSDENPSRKAMRRRILATLLAACPVGLGLLWVWMDAERLGWHDRISRMYQRAY